VTKKTDWDGTQITGSAGQRLEVWEPRWWQLGRWLHWWKFRRYHGFVNMSIPAGMHGGPCKLRLHVVPSRQAAYGDAPKGYEP
jgi:hypothetical protein